MKLLFLYFTITLALMCIAPAVSGQKAISQEKRSLIIELFKVAGAKEETHKSVEMILSFQEQESSKLFEKMLDEDKVISDEVKAEMKERSAASGRRVFTRLREFFLKEGNAIDAMLDEALFPVYDKHFNEKQLRELIGFYKSEVGQKSIKLAPELFAASISVMSEKVMPKLTEVLSKIVDEEYNQLKQDLQVPSKKVTPRP